MSLTNLSTIGLLVDWFVDQTVFEIFGNKWDGIILCFICIGLLFFQIWLWLVKLVLLEYKGYVIRCQCTNLLYKKILRLTATSSQQTSIGQVVNLVSNDLAQVKVLDIWRIWMNLILWVYSFFNYLADLIFSVYLKTRSKHYFVCVYFDSD